MTDDYEVGYTIEDEAWYAHAMKGIEPHDARTVFMVGMYSATDGGCQWEFSIRDTGSGLSVHVYDDAWTAFTAIPEFFSRLAELGRDATKVEVLDVLKGLDYRDLTQRENTHPHAFLAHLANEATS